MYCQVPEIGNEAVISNTMPTSKRDKSVSLTKVQKKPEKKRKHIEKIRSMVNDYKRVYVVKLHNPRNQKIAELRKNSVNLSLVFGKNKLTMLALGKTPKSGLRPQIDQLNKYLKGQCALLLSNLSPSELREELDAYRCLEFSRPGITAEQTVRLSPGPIPKFAHTMEPLLRQLGLPVKLIRGVIHLEKEYLVCTKNNVLTPEQCRILKLFQIEMSEFRVGLVATWTEKDGIEELESSDSYQMRTSLPPEVLVMCKKLDDGQYYFVPEACDNRIENTEAMETDEN